MTDLVIPLDTFMDIVKDHNVTVFESRAALAMNFPSVGGTVLIAYKKKPERIFKDSYPFEAIGQACLSMWDQPTEKVVPKKQQEVVNYLRRNITQLNDVAISELARIINQATAKRQKIKALKDTEKALRMVA